jgi:hypothetical protein
MLGDVDHQGSHVVSDLRDDVERELRVGVARATSSANIKSSSPPFASCRTR